MLTGSLFSGYGGLELAIALAIPRTSLAWVADNDPAPSRVLAARYSSVPNLGDVTRIDWKRLETVEVMTGGTPCQDVSHAGHRRGMTEGTRSNLWVAMREGIAALRPRLVVWENVKGVVNAHAETDLEHCSGCMGDQGTDQPRLRALGRVLGDLAELGYDAAWIDCRASDVGAPHLRNRIFLLAWPTDDEPRWADLDEPTTAPDLRGTDPLLTLLGTPAASIYRGSGGIGSPSHTHRLERSYLDAQATQLADDARLLPTPVVNDMGDGKSVDWWDDWAPRQKASDGTVAVHGPSLAIEALRLLPTPTRSDGEGGPNGHRGGGPNLRTSVTTLPTPTATDARASGGNKPKNVTLTDATVRNPDRWGKYAPAINRWATVLGLEPPPPTETSPGGIQRLSPAFVEWLMGLPPGWVTDHELGLSRTQQLRALGNGVVPQQGAHAIAEIIRRMAGRQADLWLSHGSESTSGSRATTRSSD